MRNKRLALLATTALAALVLVAAGCDWEVTVTLRAQVDPSVQVIDTATGEVVANATVTLELKSGDTDDYKYDAKDYTATFSSATGKYTFRDVEFGTYELTAQKSGMVFVRQLVEISGSDQVLPQVGGFSYDPEPEGDDLYTLRFIVFWNETFADVDAHFTFPDYGGFPVGTAPEMTGWFDTSDSPPVGFFPAETGRHRVYFEPGEREKGPSALLGGDPAIRLDLDNRGLADEPKGGPETIRILAIPDDIINAWDETISYTALAGDGSGLDAGTYTWLGTGEYYIDAFTSQPGGNTRETDAFLSTATGTGKIADPVVYAFFADKQIGRYTIPTYTNVRTASMIRVNFFRQNGDDGVEWFQVLANVRQTNYAGILSADEAAEQFEVVGSFSGRVR